MRYFLDCEFDGFNGPLISLSLVREDNESLHLIYEEHLDVKDEWVRENVIPILWDIPSPFPGYVAAVDQRRGAEILQNFFAQDSGQKHVISDWPDDLRCLCQALMVGPGTMVNVDNLYLSFHRVDAYPTELPNAIRHNSFWDAKALQKIIS